MQICNPRARGFRLSLSLSLSLVKKSPIQQAPLLLVRVPALLSANETHVRVEPRMHFISFVLVELLAAPHAISLVSMQNFPTPGVYFPLRSSSIERVRIKLLFTSSQWGEEEVKIKPKSLRCSTSQPILVGPSRRWRRTKPSCNLCRFRQRLGRTGRLSTAASLGEPRRLAYLL